VVQLKVALSEADDLIFAVIPSRFPAEEPDGEEEPGQPPGAHTRTSVQWNGLPRNEDCIPARKCLSGNNFPIQTIHAGGLFPSGMKTPDRKSSGRMIALTIGCEASAFGMTDEIANPSAPERGRSDGQHDQHLHQRTPRGDVSVVERTPEGGCDCHEKNRHEHRVQYPGAKEGCTGQGRPVDALEYPASR